jgi:hypothetical protein
MALTDTIFLAIICFILGYQLGRAQDYHNHSTQTESDSTCETVDIAQPHPEDQWVGQHLHEEEADNESLRRPLDNLGASDFERSPIAPCDRHGNPQSCEVWNCDRYAVHPSTLCPHHQCRGLHCLQHCHSLCCPYRPPRLYSN